MERNLTFLLQSSSLVQAACQKMLKLSLFVLAGSQAIVRRKNRLPRMKRGRVCL
jgi:hypothetical protein